MESLWFAIGGMVAGTLAAIPLFVLLHAIARGGRLPSLGVVVVAAVAPFLALLLVTFWLRSSHPEGVVPLGVAAALAYLASVTAAGLSSWRSQG